MYGCLNCRWLKHYISYNYYEPDDYECDIPSNLKPSFECSNEEKDRRIDRCYCNGETWNDIDDPVCPYYEYDYRKDF